MLRAECIIKRELAIYGQDSISFQNTIIMMGIVTYVFNLVLYSSFVIRFISRRPRAVTSL